MSDLVEPGPAWEIATNLGALITILEESAVNIDMMVEGFTGMAQTYRENGFDSGAVPIDAAVAALAGHATMLRMAGATLEPIVGIFHAADNGQEQGGQ